MLSGSQQHRPVDCDTSGTGQAVNADRDQPSQELWQQIEGGCDDRRNPVTAASAASPPRRYCVPKKLGPVKLIREIGRGGMGVVWLGWHELLRTDVAVKFILVRHAAPHTESLEHERFLAGARAAANIRHPGLTRILHADIVNAIPYLVMEFVPGRMIAAVQKRLGGFEPADALAILDATVEIVAHLHEHNVVHGDIKPANILLDQTGHLFLTDFGLACRVDATPAFIAGTAAYMAPEMFDGTVNTKTDVYAMGIMAYELLTGRPPFEGDRAELRMSHASSPIPRLPLQQRGVPEEVIAFIERATNRKACFRLKNAQQMLRVMRVELASCYDHRTTRDRLIGLLRRYSGTAVQHRPGASPSSARVSPSCGSRSESDGSEPTTALTEIASRKREMRRQRRFADRLLARAAAQAKETEAGIGGIDFPPADVIAGRRRPVLARWLGLLRTRLW